MHRIVSFVIAFSIVSTPALAEVLIMKCGPGKSLYKYESSFLGLSDAKILELHNGVWRRYCNSIAEHSQDFLLSQAGYKSLDLLVDGKSANCQARHAKTKNKPFGYILDFEVMRRTHYYTSSYTGRRESTTWTCTKVTPQ